MKFATALLMTIGVAAAGRLENTYLPPGSAATAGGAAFVQAPGFNGGFNRGGSVSGSVHHQGGSSSAGGSFHGQSGAYQGQSGAYRGQSGSYQGQSSSYHQGQSGSYQGQSGSYQGQSGSYQGQSAGQRGPQYAITQYNNQNNGDGGYQYNYETENGISAQESGAVQGDSQTVSGSYSYTGPDGVVYTIHYTAGPDGFHAEGAHIPTPPPIPEEIRRGVELSLAAEARGENQDGQYRAESQQGYNNYQSSGIAGGAGQHGNKGGYRY